MLCQWFLYNNGTSLPWGTVKTDSLSTLNPKSKKSPHTARSLITCHDGRVNGNKSEKLKEKTDKGMDQESLRARDPKDHLCQSSDVVFETKNIL